MKKRCSLVLAAALTLGCLAGCSRFATTPLSQRRERPLRHIGRSGRDHQRVQLGPIHLPRATMIPLT